MKGVCLKFYTQENRRHGHQLLYHWLVRVGRELDLPGCSVFQTVSGYGYHHALHSQQFFEPQGALPVEVVFALSETQAETLLARLYEEQVEVFCVRMPIEYGFVLKDEMR